jgi:hypothetical protein
MTGNGVAGLSVAAAKTAGGSPSGMHMPGSAESLLILIALAAAVGLAYRVSLWLHPFVMCRHCGGNGTTAGFWPWSRGVCPRCNGTRVVPRLGTHLLGLHARRSR